MAVLEDVELVAAAQAQQATAMRQITDSVKNAALTLWTLLGGYYPEEDIPDDFIESLAPIVLGAQATVSATTDSYLAYLLEESVTGESAVGMAVRNGTPVELVYRRPFRKVRNLVDDGMALPEALLVGADRLQSLVATDLQASQFRTAERVMSQKKDPVGWRRVLNNPSCALCTVASTQRYTRGDLAAIHENCDCGVAPIKGSVDPGRVINKRLLDEFNGQFRDSGGRLLDRAELKRLQTVSMVVNEHSELGPMLSGLVKIDS